MYFHGKAQCSIIEIQTMLHKFQQEHKSYHGKLDKLLIDACVYFLCLGKIPRSVRERIPHSFPTTICLPLEKQIANSNPLLGFYMAIHVFVFQRFDENSSWGERVCSLNFISTPQISKHITETLTQRHLHT